MNTEERNETIRRAIAERSNGYVLLRTDSEWTRKELTKLSDRQVIQAILGNPFWWKKYSYKQLPEGISEEEFNDVTDRIEDTMMIQINALSRPKLDIHTDQLKSINQILRRYAEGRIRVEFLIEEMIRYQKRYVTNMRSEAIKLAAKGDEITDDDINLSNEKVYFQPAWIEDSKVKSKEYTKTEHYTALADMISILTDTRIPAEIVDRVISQSPSDAVFTTTMPDGSPGLPGLGTILTLTMSKVIKKGLSKIKTGKRNSISRKDFEKSEDINYQEIMTKLKLIENFDLEPKGLNFRTYKELYDPEDDEESEEDDEDDEDDDDEPETPGQPLTATPMSQEREKITKKEDRTPTPEETSPVQLPGRTGRRQESQRAVDKKTSEAKREQEIIKAKQKMEESGDSSPQSIDHHRGTQPWYYLMYDNYLKKQQTGRGLRIIDHSIRFKTTIMKPITVSIVSVMRDDVILRTSNDERAMMCIATKDTSENRLIFNPVDDHRKRRY